MSGLFNVSSAVQAYIAGELEFDLTAITLRQRCSATPCVVQGKGLVRLLRGKSFALRIYADLPERPSLDMPPWPKDGDLEAGQVIPDHHFFDLEAVDIAGTRWKSEKILITPHVGMGVVMTATLNSITCTSTHSQVTNHSNITLYYFEDIELPFDKFVERKSTTDGKTLSSGFALERTEFVAGSYQFSAWKSGNKIGASVIHATVVGDSSSICIASRINETLSFAFSRRLRASIVERWDKKTQTVTLTPLPVLSRGLFYPPVPENKFQFTGDFWKLFQSYFLYVVADTDANAMHPLSAHLSRLMIDTRSNLDVMGLLVSVAVEGILKLEDFKKVGAMAPELITVIDNITKYLGEMPDADEKLMARAQGSLGGLKFPRAVDRLSALCDLGVLTNEMVETWKKLRNTTTHAATGTDPQKESVRLHRCFVVYELLNRLVLQMIRYTGQHTDYSRNGWPDTLFICRDLTK